MGNEEKQDENGPRRVDIPSPEDEQAEAPVEETEAPETAAEEPEADPKVAELTARVDELEAQAEEVAKQASEAVNERQRIAAELHNFRQRSRKEREQAIKLANESLLSSLIPVLDTFDLALQVQTDSSASESILEGVQMIQMQLLGVLQMNGVELMAVEGQKFDPALHEALEQVATADHPPETIIGELQKGYLLNGQVVRAAKVRVATKPAEGTEES